MPRNRENWRIFEPIRNQSANRPNPLCTAAYTKNVGAVIAREGRLLERAGLHGKVRRVSTKSNGYLKVMKMQVWNLEELR